MGISPLVTASSTGASLLEQCLGSPSQVCSHLPPRAFGWNFSDDSSTLVETPSPDFSIHQILIRSFQEVGSNPPWASGTRDLYWSISLCPATLTVSRPRMRIQNSRQKTNGKIYWGTPRRFMKYSLKEEPCVTQQSPDGKYKCVSVTSWLPMGL